MERQVLAAASFYSKSYYFNDLEFASLPQAVQKEVQAILVEACEYTGGVLLLGFTPDGETFLEASAAPDDPAYDEIGAKYHVHSILRSEEAFLESLSTWYNLVIKSEPS